MFAVGVVIYTSPSLTCVFPQAGLTLGVIVDLPGWIVFFRILTNSGASGSIHMVCARAPTACLVPLSIIVKATNGVHIVVFYGIITGVLTPVCVAISSALDVECVIVILGSSPDACKINLVWSEPIVLVRDVAEIIAHSFVLVVIALIP